MNLQSLRAGADNEPGWSWRWSVIAGLGFTVILLLGALVYLILNADPEPPEQQPAATPVDIMFPEPERSAPPARQAPAEEKSVDQPTDQPAPQNAIQSVARAANVVPAGNQQNPIVDAQNAEIGEWTPGDQNATQSFAPSMNVSYYDPDACTIATGSAIKAELISAAITSNEATVKAIVTNDVLCTNGERGILAGAILVGIPQSGANFGAERMDIAFSTLQQNNMEIDLEGAAAGDAMGRGGLAGKVDRHTGQTIVRVAVATAVDVAIAAAGSSIWGPLIGTPSRAVNDWASQALNRAPVISIDGSKNRIPITIITRKSIAL